MKHIDYVTNTGLTPINLEPYTEHGGGGGFKKIVAVAAAVAIPFAAPTIAGAIGLSGTIGAVMGSALVGAGLGAVAGQITGQGATRGALLGALSGGAAGYFNPGTNPTTGQDYQAFSGTKFRPDAYNAAVDAQNVANMESIVQADAGMTNIDTTPTFADGASTSTTTLNTQPVAVEGGASGVPPGTVPGQVDGGVTQFGSGANNAGSASGLQTMNADAAGLNTGSTVVNNAGAGAASNPYEVTLTGDRFSDFTNVLKGRFTDPTALADLTVQASINVLGATLLKPELSDEEQELINLQKQQLAELKAKDEKAYNFAMKQAQAFLDKAENFDVQQYARQTYGRTLNRLSQAKREALRKIDPRRAGLRAAEARRFDLGIGSQGATAYDRGMITGLKKQGDYYNKAASTFPSGGGNYSTALTGLEQTYANLAQKRSDAQKGINQMFGPLLVDGGDGNDDYQSFKLVPSSIS
tara:strand:+ start:1877 stop:3280 length:1404 start_codon:yes stop_codon:yes gene_type:complete